MPELPRRQPWMLMHFLLQLLSLTLLAVINHAHAADDLLTSEQRQWLAEHPVIEIAPDPDFPPIEYFDEHGQYHGIAADYIALLEQKLNIKFQIVDLKSWNTVLAQAKSKEVDMFGAASPTPQRLEYMNFTRPYLELPGVILLANRVHKDNITLQELKRELRANTQVIPKEQSSR